METVRPGQTFRPPNAADHNAMVAAVTLLGLQPQNTDGRGGNDSPLGTDCVRVRNDTGAARRIGDVVGLGAGVLTDWKSSNLMFAGETPAATHTVFGVLLDSLPEDKIGRVQVSGICLAYVNFAAVNDMGCIPQIGSHVLQSEPARVLWAVVTPPASASEQLVPILISVTHCDIKPA